MGNVPNYLYYVDSVTFELWLLKPTYLVSGHTQKEITWLTLRAIRS